MKVLILSILLLLFSVSNAQSGRQTSNVLEFLSKEILDSLNSSTHPAEEKLIAIQNQTYKILFYADTSIAYESLQNLEYISLSTTRDHHYNSVINEYVKFAKSSLELAADYPSLKFQIAKSNINVLNALNEKLDSSLTYHMIDQGKSETLEALNWQKSNDSWIKKQDDLFFTLLNMQYCSYNIKVDETLIQDRTLEVYIINNWLMGQARLDTSKVTIGYVTDTIRSQRISAGLRDFLQGRIRSSDKNICVLNQSMFLENDNSAQSIDLLRNKTYYIFVFYRGRLHLLLNLPNCIKQKQAFPLNH